MTASQFLLSLPYALPKTLVHREGAGGGPWMGLTCQERKGHRGWRSGNRGAGRSDGWMLGFRVGIQPITGAFRTQAGDCLGLVLVLTCTLSLFKVTDSIPHRLRSYSADPRVWGQALDHPQLRACWGACLVLSHSNTSGPLTRLLGDFGLSFPACDGGSCPK